MQTEQVWQTRPSWEKRIEDSDIVDSDIDDKDDGDNEKFDCMDQIQDFLRDQIQGLFYQTNHIFCHITFFLV